MCARLTCRAPYWAWPVVHHQSTMYCYHAGCGTGHAERECNLNIVLHAVVHNNTQRESFCDSHALRHVLLPAHTCGVLEASRGRSVWDAPQRAHLADLLAPLEVCRPALILARKGQ